jgi:long-subunit fatty acid transport protein
MKKPLFALLAMGIIPSTLLAHNIQTGTIEVTGDVDLSFFSGEKEVNGKETDIDGMSLSLSTLYYVAPNLGVGLSWAYDSSEVGSSESSETTIGPAMAFNIPIAPKMSVKPNGYFALVDGEKNNNDYDGTEWGLGVDFNYFIRDNLAIVAGVAYSSQDIDYDAGGDYKLSGFNTSVGLSVYY